MALRKFFFIFCIFFVNLFSNESFAKNSQETNTQCLPYLSSLSQTEMLVSAKVNSDNTKTYILPATPTTCQWGFFDSSQKPVLAINSGDTVIVETMAASDNQVVPGATIEQIMKFQHAIPNRGPHTLTGPIYVRDANPGDVLRIHFNKIVPRPYATNNTSPGKGLFPEDFKTPYVRYFYLDLKKNVMLFSPDIEIPLGPFPGIVAVARAKPGKYDTVPPGPFGGNMDLREITEGTTLYLPVFMQGGLLWTGDSHAGQGNGEIDLTAMETAFTELNMTIEVIKKKELAWPRVETEKNWIAVGYSKNLNDALRILKDETIQLISEKDQVSKSEAEKIMLKTWNCPIAEVVDEVQGVYCMIPKDFNTQTTELPKSDNADFFATYAKDKDLEKAMKIASKAMLDKLVSLKKLSREDAYVLASFAMDCRIGTPSSDEKEVHCMLSKKLWVG